MASVPLRTTVQPDAALLLVHGIGTKKQGKILELWSARLRRRAGECGLDIAVRPYGYADTTPAYEIWTVTPAAPRPDSRFRPPPLVDPGGGGAPRTWLVAEAHWRSAAYVPPSGPRMAWWLVTVAPWLGLFHIGANHVSPFRQLAAMGSRPRPRELVELARLSFSLYLAFVTRFAAVVLLTAVSLFVLLAWVLRLCFAETAAMRLPVTAASGVSGVGGIPPGVKDGRDTLLEPVIAQVERQPRSACRSALVFLSDGQLSDLPASEDGGRDAARRARADDVLLLVPGEDVEVPDQWTRTFPQAEPKRFDGRDRDATAVAFGETVAMLTGQRLDRR